MNYLIDTHTLIWIFYDKSKISEKVAEIIQNVKNPIFISTASIWEMAIKLSIGKLSLDHTLEEIVKECREMQFNFIEISPELSISINNLTEWHHKDPFDRMIIVTAKFFDLTLITKDSQIAKYKDLKTIW
jgi:PIN domain nuclease of toxin-antitoxin system